MIFMQDLIWQKYQYRPSTCKNTCLHTVRYCTGNFPVNTFHPTRLDNLECIVVEVPWHYVALHLHDTTRGIL